MDNKKRKYKHVKNPHIKAYLGFSNEEIFCSLRMYEDMQKLFSVNTVKYSLIENARDSLEHAMDHLTNSDGISDRDLKYAIKDVTNAVELLFKHALLSKHPAFIYKDMEKYKNNIEMMETIETVSLTGAMKRLQDFAEISLTEEQKCLVDYCKYLRNSIEHYEYEINNHMAFLAVRKIMTFIFGFTKNILKIEDFETVFSKDGKWDIFLESYNSREDHAMEIEESMIHKNVIVCPCCSKKTFDLDTSDCKLCDHKDTVLYCKECNVAVFKNFKNYTLLIDEDEDIAVLCISCYKKELRDNAVNLD